MGFNAQKSIPGPVRRVIVHIDDDRFFLVKIFSQSQIGHLNREGNRIGFLVRRDADYDVRLIDVTGILNDGFQWLFLSCRMSPYSSLFFGTFLHLHLFRV